MRQVETNVLHAYDDTVSCISFRQSVPGMDRLCIDNHTCRIHLYAAPSSCLNPAYLPAAGQSPEFSQRYGGNADVPHPGQFLTAMPVQYFRRISVNAHESRQQPFVTLSPGKLSCGECRGHRLTHKGRHFLVAGTLGTETDWQEHPKENIQKTFHLLLSIEPDTKRRDFLSAFRCKGTKNKRILQEK